MQGPFTHQHLWSLQGSSEWDFQLFRVAVNDGSPRVGARKRLLEVPCSQRLHLVSCQGQRLPGLGEQWNQALLIGCGGERGAQGAHTQGPRSFHSRTRILPQAGSVQGA